MSVPASVQIGPYAYDVILESIDIESTDVDVHEFQALGTVNPASLTIHIEPDQHPMMMRNTVLHEVIHAIRNLTGEAGDGDEETFVSSTSALLLDTLRRNPVLVAYLVDDASD